jgi:hypothetical protein
MDSLNTLPMPAQSEAMLFAFTSAMLWAVSGGKPAEAKRGRHFSTSSRASTASIVTETGVNNGTIMV